MAKFKIEYLYRVENPYTLTDALEKFSENYSIISVIKESQKSVDLEGRIKKIFDYEIILQEKE